MRAVVAAAAALGGALGLAAPAWHVALEPAQLLAGTVRYSVPTPFSVYETQVWNLWHQLLAPWLALGFAERTLTAALSGLMGVIAFAGLAGFARALGAGPALALAAPMILMIDRTIQDGFRYWIELIGRGHTYGMAGIAWLTLALAALAGERFRLAGLLVGLGPGLHASLGAWLALAIGLAALAAPRALRQHARPFLTGALLGAALCGVSIALHRALAPPAPASEAALAERYLRAFIHLWDYHRRPPDLTRHASFLAWCTIVTALVWLRTERKQLGPGAALALRTLVVCGTLGFASAVLLAAVADDRLPTLLLVAMPARLGNLVVLLAVPLALAAVARSPEPVPRGLVVAGGFCLWLAIPAPYWWHRIELGSAGTGLIVVAGLLAQLRSAESSRVAAAGAAGLFGWLALRAVWPGFAGPGASSPPGDLSRDFLCGAFALACIAATWLGPPAAGARAARLLRAVPAATLAAVSLGVLAATAARAPERWAELTDWTNHPVLARAQRGEGLLLLGPGIGTAQLRTRRPVLLDPGALDMLPYVPAVGPALEEILREVYGVEYFRPPPAALGSGVVPGRAVGATFARRSPEAWRTLRVRFDVREVLVPEKLQLRLPLLASGGGYALYALPE